MAKRGRKRKMETEDKVAFEWEKEKIFPDNLRDEMETSWELPQLYHFLQLTKEAFNITHLSMYEVERMLLMPKASKQLAHIMTCLLSNPLTTKSKLHKVPLMPYSFWTNILMYKLKNWFKIYQSKRQDPIKTFDTLGIEPEFWNIFPINEIEGKDFQEFSFRQRIWLLKTVCDTAVYTRKAIQDEISRQPWENQFETILGTDRYGARYVYFPQFLHNDLRVYRQCLDNKVLSTVKRPAREIKPTVEETIVPKEATLRPAAPRGRRKKRRSRWSKGALPTKIQKKPARMRFDCNQVVEQSVVDSSSNSTDTGRESRCSSKASEFSTSSCAKSSGYDTNASADLIDSKGEKDSSDVKDSTEVESEMKVEEDVSLSSDLNTTEESVAVEKEDEDESLEDKSLTKSENEDSLAKESTNLTTIDDLSKSSKTDDEKLEEMNATKSLEKVEPDVNLFLNLTKDLNTISKSDDEKLSESKKCDTLTDAASECASDELSLDKWMKKKMEENKREEDNKPVDSDNEANDSALNSSCSRRSARIKYIAEIKSEVEDAENLVDVCESEELTSIDLRDSLCRVSSPEDNFCNEDFNESDWKVTDFNEMMTELGVSSFQLVADSLSSLKDLTAYISSDRTIPDYESKDKYVPPSCETKLVKRLKTLVTSLENVENILKESTKKARNKLQREWANFENGEAEEDQEQQDGEEGAANRWLVGPQGCSLERLLSNNSGGGGGGGADQHTEVLPQPALSRDGVDEPDSKEPQADTPAEASAAGPADQAGQAQEKADPAERLSGEGHGEEEEKSDDKGDKKEQLEQGAGAHRVEDDDKETEGPTKEAEPRQTRRTLRARGVPSYTEQLFSDDESDEEQLDGWADIEAVYAPAGPSVGVPHAVPSTTTQPASASGTASGSVTGADSYDDEDEEDSDQDWILPGSRKRKSKRPSASRRLKTFQHKIQNIQDNKAADDNQQQQQQQQQQQSPPKVPAGKVAISRQSYTRRYNQQISKLQSINYNRKVPVPQAAAAAVPQTETVIKTEPQDTNLHSVLDIKDEGPIYETTSSSQPNVTAGVQQNYVVVTAGQAPVANYYVMQQNPSSVMQHNQYIQPTAYVPQMAPSVFVHTQQVQNVPTQGYYVQPANPAPNYIVQNPGGIIATAPRQAFIASSTPVVYQQQPGPPQLMPTQQQQIVAPNYVQYIASPVHPQQQQPQQQRVAQPRIINTTTLTPPRQIAYRPRAPGVINRMPGPLQVGPRPSFPHPPNGAVIRSAPINANSVRPGMRVGQLRMPAPRRQVAPKQHAPGDKKAVPGKAKAAAAGRAPKSTSLIVLSDSDDDEIEMIIPEGSPAKPHPKKIAPATASPSKKSAIPPELLERMNEGNISLSPIKPAAPPQPPQQGNATQLVVVVNETGSHYALALPNGSKLILTPEQVAQIRASNGGKLLL